MAVQIAIGFVGRDSGDELFSDGDNIVDAMTTQAVFFPAPDPTLVLLAGHIGDFRTAVNKANGGGGAETATKNNVRTVLEDDLREEALNVQKVVKNDLAKLLLSGSPARKGASPAGVLDAPADLRLKRSEITGQLIARANRVVNAASYEWRYALNTAPGTWLDGGTTTSTRKVFEGLTPGTTYTIQIRAIGSAGPSAWSDPARLMAA